MTCRSSDNNEDTPRYGQLSDAADTAVIMRGRIDEDGCI